MRGVGFVESQSGEFDSECLELLEKLSNLAKIDLSNMDLGDLCSYLRGVQEMMRGLKASVEKYGDPPPLYYVWEGEDLPLPRRTQRDRLELDALLGDRLDQDHRVVLPWRPRG